jgi:hypothetical protein
MLMRNGIVANNGEVVRAEAIAGPGIASVTAMSAASGGTIACRKEIPRGGMSSTESRGPVEAERSRTSIG